MTETSDHKRFETDEEKRKELLRIAEVAVQHSGERLRLAHNEDDASENFVADAAHFIKFDGKRVGRDVELYGMMGELVEGWQSTLVRFLEEVLMPLKRELPESYAKAGEALRILGESVYPAEILQDWRGIF
jgi:hypothetical protein